MRGLRLFWYKVFLAFVNKFMLKRCKDTIKKTNFRSCPFQYEGYPKPLGRVLWVFFCSIWSPCRNGQILRLPCHNRHIPPFHEGDIYPLYWENVPYQNNGHPNL